MSEMDFRKVLEGKLKSILNPVMPNSGFINELQKKLTTKPDVSVEYPNYLMPVLLLSSGLVAGVILILVLSRLFRILSFRKLENPN